jgi:PAS domain S-box-containing protein
VLIDLALNSDQQTEKEYTRIQRIGDTLFGEAFTPSLSPGDVHLSATASVLRNAKGEIIAAIECIRDNTEQKQLKDRLIESEKKYRDLVDNALVGVYQTGLDGNIYFANQEFARMFGYDSPEDLMKRSVVSLYKNHHAREAFVEELKKRKTIKSYELELFTENGEIRHVLLSGVLEGDRLSGTLMDITERKKAEEERRRLEERLSNAEKMEALGTLAGGVAHDLNNVLGILVGYSELLLEEIEPLSPVRSHVKKIMEGGERAAAIVTDMLTIARRGVHAGKVINLNEIIVSYRKSPEFAKLCSFHLGVNIKSSLAPDLLNIMGSPIHMTKTLMNLVSNAAEAMPKGGTLTVETKNRYLDRPIRGYDDVKDGDYVVLSVSDTGDGIKPEDLKRIFEPFYTKKVMGRSGTGLGLSVVWGTVKDHGGYIDVHSEEGTGTTFNLYFPITRESASGEDVYISRKEYMGKGESIVVVDDVEGQRDLAYQMLSRLNYKVAAFSSGEKAVDYLKNNKADLVVLDMIMDPGMDGLDTYRKILETHPLQKAIIVSGFSETERVLEAEALGVGAYVRKPYVQERLGLAVRKELDRSR